MGDEDTSGRKRQRLSTQPHYPPSLIAAGSSSATSLAASLTSPDPRTKAGALNSLLQICQDDRTNYALGPGGDAVVNALVTVFDDAIGWDGGDCCLKSGDGDDKDLIPSERTWEDGCSLNDDDDDDDDGGLPRSDSWPAFCRRRLSSPLLSYIHPSAFVSESDVKVMDAVVVVLRNLSYVASNLRFLAHSTGVLRILVGSLYYRAFNRGGGGCGADDADAEGARIGSARGQGGGGGPTGSNVCVHSLHALLNLAPFLDPTGRKYFTDRVFLDPSRGGSDAAAVVPHDGTYGRAASLGFGGMLIAKRFEVRDEALSKVPSDVVRGISARHMRAVLSLFPALLYALQCDASRPAAVAALEVLTALVDGPDCRDVFLCAPNSLLGRLVDLLYVPRLGPDGLEYVNPVCNVVSRVSTLKLLMGYDASVDSELRDRSAELLLKLTGLGPDLRRRLGRRLPVVCEFDWSSSSALSETPKAGRGIRQRNPGGPNTPLYDALAAMLTTQTGRGDARQLAARLLANLASTAENRDGLQYIESRAVEASSRCPHVANIICNSVFHQAV